MIPDFRIWNMKVLWWLYKCSIKLDYTYPWPVVFQWQSSGNPVCLEVRPQCTLEWHWRRIVGSRCFQCASSGIPVAFQWSSSVFQLCKLTLDRHWDTTGCYHQSVWFQWHPSVPVGPVVFQCGLSSGIPVYWQNLVLEVIGQVTSKHVTPNVYSWYGESCLS